MPEQVYWSRRSLSGKVFKKNRQSSFSPHKENEKGEKLSFVEFWCIEGHVYVASTIHLGYKVH